MVLNTISDGIKYHQCSPGPYFTGQESTLRMVFNTIISDNTEMQCVGEFPVMTNIDPLLPHNNRLSSLCYTREKKFL